MDISNPFELHWYLKCDLRFFVLEGVQRLIYSLQYILGVKEKDKVSLHHLNPVLVHLTISDESTQ